MTTFRQIEAKIWDFDRISNSYAKTCQVSLRNFLEEDK